jgi:adenine-specific DNA-methyltransferase
VPFIEKGLSLLKDDGFMSMIIPYPFLNQLYSKQSRINIIDNYNLIMVADLYSEKVFKDAVVKNCILVVEKSSPKGKTELNILNKEKLFVYAGEYKYHEFITNKSTHVWDFNLKGRNIKKDFRLKLLGDLCFISKGMVLNADEKKALGKFTKSDLISDKGTKKHIKKYIEAKNIDRFSIVKSRWLEWNTRRVPSLISRPTFSELYEIPKLLVNKIGRLKATYDNESYYCDQTIRIIVLWKYLKEIDNRSISNSLKKWYHYPRKILEENSEKFDYYYLLAVLNSKLGTYSVSKKDCLIFFDIFQENGNDLRYPG